MSGRDRGRGRRGINRGGNRGGNRGRNNFGRLSRSSSIASNLSLLSAFSGASNFSSPGFGIKKIEIRKPQSNQREITSISSVDFDVEFHFRNGKDYYKYTIIQLLLVALYTCISSRLHGFGISKSRSVSKDRKEQTEKLTVDQLLTKNLQNIKNRIPDFVTEPVVETFITYFSRISNLFKKIKKAVLQTGATTSNGQEQSRNGNDKNKKKENRRVRIDDSNDVSEFNEDS